MSTISHDISSEANKISIVIPVYNDPKGIATTLDSLVEQDYPSKLYEILVVDNDSTDDTLDVVLDYKEDHTNIIRSLRETEIQSSYAARNKGIENAENGVIVFIDSDMWVDDNWLDKVSKVFKEDEPRYVGFDVKIVKKDRSFSALYDEVTGFPVKDYLEEDHFCPTCCLAVSKEIIKEVGRFDEDLISSGDREFGHRVYENGYDQSFIEDITVYHPARSSFRSHIKKWIRLGRGVYQLNDNYPERYSEEKRNVLNPIYYTPPSPEIIEKIKRRGRDRSFIDKTGIVSMKWIEKIFTHYGYFYEKYDG